MATVAQRDAFNADPKNVNKKNALTVNEFDGALAGLIAGDIVGEEIFDYEIVVSGAPNGDDDDVFVVTGVSYNNAGKFIRIDIEEKIKAKK